MVDKSFLRDLKRNKPPGSRGRSNLYRYILEHWDGIQACGYGTDDGPTWQELTDRLAHHGQVNARGAPLQRLKVREVFLRVQADVMAAQAQRRIGIAAPKKPSRMPAGWQPPVAQAAPTQAPMVTPSHQTRPAQNEPAPFAPTPNKQEAAKPVGAESRDMLAELWSDIDKRSGRSGRTSS
jgi:hypothetical protein